MELLIDVRFVRLHQLLAAQHAVEKGVGRAGHEEPMITNAGGGEPQIGHATTAGEARRHPDRRASEREQKDGQAAAARRRHRVQAALVRLIEEVFCSAQARIRRTNTAEASNADAKMTRARMRPTCYRRATRLPGS